MKQLKLIKRNGVEVEHTTFYDKNGDAICEGDYLESEQGNINKVVWYHGGWYIRRKVNGENKYWQLYLHAKNMTIDW